MRLYQDAVQVEYRPGTYSIIIIINPLFLQEGPIEIKRISSSRLPKLQTKQTIIINQQTKLKQQLD